MIRILLFLTFVLVTVTGCMTTPVPEARQEIEITALTKDLCALSPQVDAGEARRAAEVSVGYPLQLAWTWHVTPPAVFNNVLVNTGVHPRGLCFQWADSLTEKLMMLHLHTLEWHRGVAHLGTKHEHSSVVLTAPSQSFDKGIALDAWRHCGKIHWAVVTKDSYPWKEVVLEPEYQAELRAGEEKLETGSK